MSNEKDSENFYKFSFYSSAVLVVILAAAFSYTIFKFRSGIEKSVEEEINILRKEVANAINNSKDTEGLEKLSSFLTGQFNNVVVPFNTSNCPIGWEEYKLAYGRFIRGIDKSAHKIDPDGQRIPGSTQNDSFKRHSHSYTTGGIWGRSFKGDSSGPKTAHQKNAATSEVGSSETRPKNVALLYCTKLPSSEPL